MVAIGPQSQVVLLSAALGDGDGDGDGALGLSRGPGTPLAHIEGQRIVNEPLDANADCGQDAGAVQPHRQPGAFTLSTSGPAGSDQSDSAMYRASSVRMSSRCGAGSCRY